MQAKEICARVEALALPLAEAEGLALWDVAFEQEGGLFALTVALDSAENLVDLDRCEAISRALDPMLDAKEFDAMPSYTLCVSSAGLTRRLTRPRHFEQSVGRAIDLKLYRPKDGSKEWTDTLEAFDGKTLALAGGAALDLKEVARAQWAFVPER